MTRARRTARHCACAALVLTLAACAAPQQTSQSARIFPDVPPTIDVNARYLFHMHGTVVEESGPWGRNKHGQYRYYPTVEALADRGFVVISEVRKPTEVVPYAFKVAGQVARLRAAGVPADHITVTGMSKGGFITVLTTVAIANPDVRFVILAGCLRGQTFPRALAAAGNRPPQGRVLSLYDYADPDIGSCTANFPPTPGLVFEEFVFQTGRGHALFFAPDPVWIDRVAAWALRPDRGPAVPGPSGGLTARREGGVARREVFTHDSTFPYIQTRMRPANRYRRMRMISGSTIVGTALLLATSALAQAPSGVVAASASGSAVLAVGQDVGPGTHVVTGADGPVQLLLRDGSTITVGPRSDLTIDRFTYDPETHSGRLTMTAAAGLVRVVGGRATKEEPVVIETPSATIALRGGISIVGVDAANGTTEATFAYGRSETATSKSTGETRATTRFGSTVTIGVGQPIATAHIEPARLSALLGTLAGGPGRDGGATTLPDPNAPIARAIADENSGRAVSAPPSSITQRLDAVTSVTNQLVAQTEQSITAAKIPGLAGSSSSATQTVLTTSSGQSVTLTRASNGIISQTSSGVFLGTFRIPFSSANIAQASSNLSIGPTAIPNSVQFPTLTAAQIAQLQSGRTVTVGPFTFGSDASGSFISIGSVVLRR